MPSYAEIRRQELKHIEQSLKDDRKMKRAIGEIYRNSSEDIQRHIDADIMRFADKESVSMAEAKKIISKTDVEAFQSTAKKMVDRNDRSPVANKQLRRYNVTLRTNRLELLKARINLETVELALQEEKLISAGITDAMMNEFERQSGILNMSTPSRSKIERMARSSALADVSGVSFSDRVWANQNELREQLNVGIERALIRGEHPRNAAAGIKRLVRDEYGMSKRAADRIAVTEVARAQGIAQIESFKDAGIDKYIWVAENQPCPDCKELDGQIFGLDEYEAFKTAIPKHPNCLCSLAAYVE